MNENLTKIATLIRYYILEMTFKAQSGHVTSSLSSVEIMTGLFFKHFRFDLDDPKNLNNDRLIFSKGHASPLFYALYKVAGVISEEELYKYRTFESNLEGHPTMRFPFTEAPTGSLGQGLSIGVGEALALRAKYQVSGIKYQDNSSKTLTHDTLTHDTAQKPKVFVLLGDGEMAEGQVWEAIQIASHYKLNNLIAILDVNALGQSESTMSGDNTQDYANKLNSFGWRVYIVRDGHDLNLVDKAYSLAIEQSKVSDKPAVIIFKTIKGKGVSFIENKLGWHGKVLNKEEHNLATQELGEVDKTLVVSLRTQSELGAAISDQKIASSLITPRNDNNLLRTSPTCASRNYELRTINYKLNTNISTRQVFGEALVNLGKINASIVVLDGDVKNSTYTELFEKEFPDRFYQMYIAEQNMVSCALGMATMGCKPVVSTFASFLTRAVDQIRMANLANQNMIINGTHGGVSIGQDGPSQMGLEDISFFRTQLNTIVLYASDAVCTSKLLFETQNQKGMIYFRTQRPETPVIYSNDEEFKIGGSKSFVSGIKSDVSSIKYQVSSSENNNMTHDTLTQNNLTHDTITIVAAGITVIEALKAQKELAKENIDITVIDCYSIKPIDKKTLIKAAQSSKIIITVEDHYVVGGLGDAVLESLSEIKSCPVYKMGVTKVPRSGNPQELLQYEEIDSGAIIKKVKKYVK